MAEFSKNDYRFFEMAKEIAEQSPCVRFKLGAVVVSSHGYVISTGYNSNKTHPLQRYYNKKYRTFKYSGGKPIYDLIHAEMQALISIPKCVDLNLDYSKVKIYIYRICPGKRLGFGNSFPCPACRHALMDRGIRNIYYTTDTGYAYQKLF